jgi:asparagine synthase (glutamine-hydrolysing)
VVGGWGMRAVELLERAAGRAGSRLDRAGSTAILGMSGTTEGEWRCWMSGRLTNADVLLSDPRSSNSAHLLTAIARLHARIGPPACDLLRGTFALVAVDLARDVAFVGRDHLGGNPLVYIRIGRGALFAEHERDILDLLPHTPGPDRPALTQLIDTGSTPPGRTLYDGIRRVPPGHRLVLSDTGVGLERYWSPRFDGTTSGSRQEIVEQLRSEVFAAVDRAARGSGRVAVRLSGGLDSACVASGLAARRPVSGNALALSAVFPDQHETDERELIEATARHTGLTVEMISFRDRIPILRPALQHIDLWRLPPASPNLFVWQPLMARARRLGVDVLLDGEGGDELFGLASHLIADCLRRGRLGMAWRLTGDIPGIGSHPYPQARLRVMRMFGLRDLVPDSLRRWRRHRAAARPRNSLLASRDLVVLAGLEDESDSDRLEGPYWWRALAAELTQRCDTLGMASHFHREALAEKIEGSHPFLFDRDLVDSVLANPPHLQFDPDRDRPLLRDALAGQIPEEVRSRHAKSYFTPLLSAALAGPDGNRLFSALARADAPIRSFLRTDYLDRLLERGAGDVTIAARLWRIGMVDTWLRACEQPEYSSEFLGGPAMDLPLK